MTKVVSNIIVICLFCTIGKSSKQNHYVSTQLQAFEKKQP